MGTAAYLPPEVARGEVADIRGDLYTLGVILYEMVAGGLPFSAANLLAMVMHHAFLPPPLLPESVPKPLQTIITQLLEKAPEDRPANSTELRVMLAGALRHIQNAEGLLTVPSNQGRRIWLGLLALLLVGVAAYLWSREISLTQAPLDAQVMQAIAPAIERADATPVSDVAMIMDAAPVSDVAMVMDAAPVSDVASDTKAPKVKKKRTQHRKKPMKIKKKAPTNAAPEFIIKNAESKRNKTGPRFFTEEPP